MKNTSLKIQDGSIWVDGVKTTDNSLIGEKLKEFVSYYPEGGLIRRYYPLERPCVCNLGSYQLYLKHQVEKQSGRLTKDRLEVLSALYHAGYWMSVKQIRLELSIKGIHFPISTIYNVVDLLQQIGILEVIKSGFQSYYSLKRDFDVLQAVFNPK